MSEEMRRDKNVFVMGEEVAEYNGAYKVTQGMLDEFGPERMYDTPIAELGFAGLGVGAAINGLRPIIEFMTFNFSLVAIDQIINSAAKILAMSAGQYGCPIVFRGPTGNAGQLGAQHSSNFENWYANTPGLKVVVPSNPYDAKGLLISAIRDNDPVVFLEHMKLYRSFRQEVPEEEYTIEIGKADVKREGTDLSIITYGAMVHESLKAADELEKDGVSVEVVDLRTISPLDIDTIIASVEKTGRVIVVQEAQKQAGIAANVVAEITERAILSLEAPVLRVTAPDTVYAFTEAENIWLPIYKDIIETAKKVVNF
jgi:pyruvate dehydrogenase E1 component beta subunit